MEKSKIELVENKTYPSKILGLDISTSCIGASIIYDDGVNPPVIEKITHVVPKISNKISNKSIEALIKRKEIFEDEFLSNLTDAGITECVIEAPLIFALGNSNPTTVAQLLKFNALLSEAIYYKLGIIPYYISSLDARVYAFPELLGLRKFNRKGEEYDLKHIKTDIKNNHIVPFADFSYDCDKKNDFKKENFDACDSLVCCLGYSNLKRYGELIPKIDGVIIEDLNTYYNISYDISFWDKKIQKEMKIIKK